MPRTSGAKKIRKLTGVPWGAGCYGWGVEGRWKKMIAYFLIMTSIVASAVLIVVRSILCLLAWALRLAWAALKLIGRAVRYIARKATSRSNAPQA